MSQEKTDLPGDEQPQAVFDTPEAAGRPQQTASDAATAADVEPDEDEARQATTDAPGNDDPAALREALQQVSADAERYRDQALRAVAETENIRKRAQRDVAAARKFALEKFASELLGVRDSLELGLAASEGEQTDAAQLAEGMKLTGRMLANAMEKFGIEVVNPQGEEFNPELHEAVSMQETDAQAANSVVSVMQKGYTLNGRVLRAAMVIVAKAPSAGT